MELNASDVKKVLTEKFPVCRFSKLETQLNNYVTDSFHVGTLS